MTGNEYLKRIAREADRLGLTVEQVDTRMPGRVRLRSRDGFYIEVGDGIDPLEALERLALGPKP